MLWGANEIESLTANQLTAGTITGQEIILASSDATASVIHSDDYNGTWDETDPTYNYGKISFLGDAAACAAGALDLKEGARLILSGQKGALSPARIPILSAGTGEPLTDLGPEAGEWAAWYAKAYGR